MNTIKSDHPLEDFNGAPLSKIVEYINNNSEKIESNDLAKTCDMIRYYETKLNIDFLENL